MLRFYCVWDDRSALYGDRRPYRLHAFPDGSIEILETRDANSGRDPFPVFLRRGLLPKAGCYCCALCCGGHHAIWAWSLRACSGWMSDAQTKWCEEILLPRSGNVFLMVRHCLHAPPAHRRS